MRAFLCLYSRLPSNNFVCVLNKSQTCIYLCVFSYIFNALKYVVGCICVGVSVFLCMRVCMCIHECFFEGWNAGLFSEGYLISFLPLVTRPFKHIAPSFDDYSSNDAWVTAILQLLTVLQWYCLLRVKKVLLGYTIETLVQFFTVYLHFLFQAL